MNFIQRLISPLLMKDARRQLMFGNRKKAMTLFQTLYDWSPTVENTFQLALCLMNLRRYDEALALFKTAHEALPDQLMTGLTYAQCLLLSRRFEEANQLYYKLLEFHTNNPTLSTLISLSDDPVGRDKYATSMDLQFQASLLQEEKQYQTALDLLQTAVRLLPRDAALHNNLGVLKLKLNLPPEEVMANFAMAMELKPDNDLYRRNYRRVWQKIKK